MNGWQAGINVSDSEPTITLAQAKVVTLLTEDSVLSVDEIVDEGVFLVTIASSVGKKIEENGCWEWVGPQGQSITFEMP